MLYLSGVVKPHLPAMLTPDIRNAPPEGLPWAADNGCYTQPARYSDERYLAFLGKLRGEAGRCLFATAPDVVGDAEATLTRSLPMLPRIREAGYPVALVVQPVTTPDMVPWDDLDAIFIGGPNHWQHSESLIVLVREAKRRGKWVHMGRVNGLRRMRYAESIGCDSADGTVLRFDPNRRPDLWAAHVLANPSLGLT